MGDQLLRYESKSKKLLFSTSDRVMSNAFNRTISIFKRDKSDDLDKSNDNFTDLEKVDNVKSLTPLSLCQSNEYLESALSPKSVESQTSCRSHDGVFLRPDAISTQSSPISSSSSSSTTPTMTALLSHRLTKRTSVDSGINLDLPIPSFRSSIWTRTKSQSREFQLMNSSNSITTAASLVTAATAAGIDTTNDSFSLCKWNFVFFGSFSTSL